MSTTKSKLCMFTTGICRHGHANHLDHTLILPQTRSLAPSAHRGLLTIRDNIAYSLSFFCLQLSYFAYSPFRCLDTHSHFRQTFLFACKTVVSRKTLIASQKLQLQGEKAAKHNCKQKTIVSRKLPIVSKKLHPIFFWQVIAGSITA